MIRIAVLAMVLVAGVSAEDTVAAEVGRTGGGPEGYSQQYHYASYPQNDHHVGHSFDISTGILLAVGVIVLLLIVASVAGGRGHGEGWRSASSTRSLNMANMSEKVLHGLERMYEAYNKNQ